MSIGRTERLLDHRRAFDMPARAAGTERAFPRRLAGLGGFPQHEVGRMPLVRRDLDSGAGDHVVQRAARKLAILSIALGVEEDVPLRDVGRVVANQPLDQGNDRPHVRCRARLVAGPERAQRGDVGVIGGDVARGHRVDRHALGRRLGVDLVVDVGEVGGIDDVFLAIQAPQQTKQHVEHHHRPGVADVDIVVDRRPTDIEPYPRRIDRNEVALLAREGVVKAQAH